MTMRVAIAYQKMKLNLFDLYTKRRNRVLDSAPTEHTDKELTLLDNLIEECLP